MAKKTLNEVFASMSAMIEARTDAMIEKRAAAKSNHPFLIETIQNNYPPLPIFRQEDFVGKKNSESWEITGLEQKAYELQQAKEAWEGFKNQEKPEDTITYDIFPVDYITNDKKPFMDLALEIFNKKPLVDSVKTLPTSFVLPDYLAKKM